MSEAFDKLGLEKTIRFLDEEASEVVIPGAAHGHAAEQGPGRAEVAAEAADHSSSEVGERREPSDNRRPVHEAETRCSIIV